MNILELAILKKMVGGGGGSGTDNYNDLSNLPQINGETLAGNKTAENLGLQDALTFDSTPTEDSTNPVESGGVFNALAGKQDNLTFDGTYDASTNKAATESTVTDAINELDISETSFDADETIDTISETDGKIAVTKKDIAIASNQVTSMTGYTKPSSAPATPAIQTNDTANQAFGKLEFKADTNQTNILLVQDATEELVDESAKNKFNPEKEILYGYVTDGNGYAFKSVIHDTRNVLTFVLLAYNNDTFVRELNSADIISTGLFSFTFVKGSDFNSLRFGHSGEVQDIKVYADVSDLVNGETYVLSFNATAINPSVLIAWNSTMICAKAKWDVSHNFEPHTLPNYDLTYLQAEDRAALVESINKGAKNLLPKLKSYTDSGLSMVINDDNSITAKWSATGGSTLYARINDNNWTLPRGTYVLSGMPNDSNIGCYIHIETNTSQLVVQQERKTPVEFSIANDYEYLKIYISVRPNSAAETSGVTILPMIVTKAISDIGADSYVPPALSNYDLTVREAEDRAALAEQVDSGAKNILDEWNEILKNLHTSGNSVTRHGITYTYDNGTITMSGTANNPSEAKATLFLLIDTMKISNESYVVSWRSKAISNAQISVKYLNMSETIESTDSVIELPANRTDSASLWIAIPNGTTVSGSIDIMICTLADWNVSHKYAPYTLPNTDLTRMMTPFFTVPINHNMIYRGQNLGETFTEAQDTALSSGNFTDLYLGDYWTKQITIPAFYEVTTAEPADWSTNYTSYYTKSGDTYTPVTGDTAPTWAANTYYERLVPSQTVTLKAVIADFDTFYAGYASGHAAINSHHAAVVVHGFNNAVWNKTNTTAGGYVNSLIHKWLVGSALPQIETWFGSANVLSHQKLLTNAITGDAASGWAWSSQKISLLSENQMYGSKVWGNSKAANGGYEPGEAFKHLNVFNHIDANLLFGNKNIWLRDIASAVWVAFLYNVGYASCDDASATGIAPAALILLS